MEAKESRRWTEGAEIAAEQLARASQVVVVADQEADIFSHFARRPPQFRLCLADIALVPIEDWNAARKENAQRITGPGQTLLSPILRPDRVVHFALRQLQT
jgi:hypothetical protein